MKDPHGQHETRKVPNDIDKYLVLQLHEKSQAMIMPLGLKSCEIMDLWYQWERLNSFKMLWKELKGEKKWLSESSSSW